MKPIKATRQKRRPSCGCSFVLEYRRYLNLDEEYCILCYYRRNSAEDLKRSYYYHGDNTYKKDPAIPYKAFFDLT